MGTRAAVAAGPGDLAQVVVAPLVALGVAGDAGPDADADHQDATEHGHRAHVELKAAATTRGATTT